MCKMFEEICDRGWIYAHFGTPCSSFSRLRVCFKNSSRKRGVPLGDGSRTDELLGNALVDFTFEHIEKLHERRCAFSLEHPTSFFAWECPRVQRRARRPWAQKVRQCQRAYGLSLPTAPS